MSDPSCRVLPSSPPRALLCLLPPTFFFGKHGFCLSLFPQESAGFIFHEIVLTGLPQSRHDVYLSLTPFGVPNSLNALDRW